jgi:hypothetical protein
MGTALPKTQILLTILPKPSWSLIRCSVIALHKGRSFGLNCRKIASGGSRIYIFLRNQITSISHAPTDRTFKKNIVGFHLIAQELWI